MKIFQTDNTQKVHSVLLNNVGSFFLSSLHDKNRKKVEKNYQEKKIISELIFIMKRILHEASSKWDDKRAKKHIKKYSIATAGSEWVFHKSHNQQIACGNKQL